MTDDTTRCARGPRCATRVQTDPGQSGDRHVWVGGPSTRPLCDVDEQRVREALEDAPELYRQLRGATLVRGQADPGEKVTRSSGSPMPVNARALHLAEDLAWLLVTWEEVVRDVARLRPPDAGGKREGRQVADAARVLQAHLSAWIAAPAATLATSRWTEDVEQSGAEAAAALLDWRSQVRALPGLDMQAPKAVRRYTQRCPGCGVRAITHRAGDDLMHCQSCGATQPYMPTLPVEADYLVEESA